MPQCIGVSMCVYLCGRPSVSLCVCVYCILSAFLGREIFGSMCACYDDFYGKRKNISTNDGIIYIILGTVYSQSYL